MSTDNSEEALRPLHGDTIRILVDNHKRFRSFLANRLPSDAIAEDILQQSLKKALEKPPAASEEQSIVAWFYRVLRNCTADFYRQQDSEERKHESLRISAETASAAEDLEAEVCACMKGLLTTLKPEYAEVLNRIDLGGETTEMVAQSLGISRANADVRLHRARQALKTSLIRTCGTCTEHGCLNCTCDSPSGC